MSDGAQQGFAFGAGSPLNLAPAPATPLLVVPEDAHRVVTAASPQFSLNQFDAVQWLRSLPNESVDLVVTDPPYESLEKHRAIGTTTRLKHSKASSNDWFQIFPNTRFAELFEEVYRVLRKGTHFYLFCDAETMFVAQPIAQAAGFRFWKPLVWDKRKIGMGYHYRARCEFILFFEKGKRRLNDLAQPDVIECTRIRGGYPTEKPALVSSILVRQSTRAGEVVIDPFMGSGSVGEAALGLGRHFMGNDVSPTALEWSNKRLQAWGQAGDPLSLARPQLL
jgi:site-specific DNA-methyltransferase (adenine-specific)